MTKENSFRPEKHKSERTRKQSNNCSSCSTERYQADLASRSWTFFSMASCFPEEADQILSKSSRVKAFSRAKKRISCSNFSTYCGWCKQSRRTKSNTLFSWSHFWRIDARNLKQTKKSTASSSYHAFVGCEHVVFIIFVESVWPIRKFNVVYKFVQLIECVHFPIERIRLKKTKTNKCSIIRSDFKGSIVSTEESAFAGKYRDVYKLNNHLELEMKYFSAIWSMMKYYHSLIRIYYPISYQALSNRLNIVGCVSR